MEEISGNNRHTKSNILPRDYQSPSASGRIAEIRMV